MIPGVKLIDDILKGLPENARLREQLGELRLQVQSLQSENERLKAQLEALKTKVDDLKEDTVKVLRVFFNAGRNLSLEHVAQQLQLQPSVTEFHFGVLMKRRLLRQTRVGFGGGSGAFGLTHEGLKYAMEHPA